MALTWRAKRQLLFLGIFGAILGVILWGLFSKLVPSPSCTDGRQNQQEEGVDCGGPCVPCARNAKEPVILWTRFFPLTPGHFEAASLVENVNPNFGAKSAAYRRRLYDAKNILIASKEGKTFINPGERFVIYEPDIAVFKRVPVRAALEFSPVLWAPPDRDKPQLLVTEKEFQNDPVGKVRLKLRNEGLFAIENIEIAAVLLDAGGNAAGTSVSRVSRLEGEKELELFFTWRAPFEEPPERVEIFWRINRFGK
ncbi:MAG: hypothetical protein AAB846_01395 [Patescibacteria group bacterium]